MGGIDCAFPVMQWKGWNRALVQEIERHETVANCLKGGKRMGNARKRKA